MAVKRIGMAQALTRPQTVQRQPLSVPNTTTTAINPLSEGADSLNQANFGQALINKAVSGQGFDPQGGWGVAAAQIATAGIGAWAQNRARKDIAEKEVASQEAYGTFLKGKGYTDESIAAINASSTPESRNASIQDFMKQDLKAANPEPLTGIAKLAADYKAGLIDESTYRSTVKKETSFAPDASSSGGAIGAIINNLRKENPKLTYAQALTLAQGLARQALTYDDDGNIITQPGLNKAKSDVAAAESKGTAVGKKESELAGKSIVAPAVLDLISQAEELLPQATSGRLQNIYTAGTQVAGKSTNMSKADSRLDVIAADLTSSVPRMEGPQSDADTKLYKEAAGNVGNRNLPSGDRLAALQTIKGINEKYLANKPTNNQPRVRRFNPQTKRLE